MTLNERMKPNCLMSEESCPDLELLRKGLGYRRGTLSSLESERAPASDPARARAEATWRAK